MKAKRRKQLGGKSAKNISSSFKAPAPSGLQTPNKFGALGSSGRANRLSTAEKLQEYQNRLNKGHSVNSNENSLKKESSLGGNGKPEAENRLGSSIAAMNSSITEKWRKINSSGLKSHAGLNNTVGGGFKAKALQDKSTLDKDSNENEGEPADPNKSAKTKMALQARLNEVKVSFPISAFF